MADAKPLMNLPKPTAMEEGTAATTAQKMQ